MMRAMASSRLLLRALLVAFALSGLCAQRAWAATAAGTSITNFMTVNYQDASSNNYNTISNTVTTLVANLPLLTVTASAAQSVTMGMIALDTFTLTNTGNGSGNFQIPTAATFAGTASGTTLDGYVLSSGPCAVTTPCILGALETQMAALSATAAGGTLTVGVEYTVSANTTTVGLGQSVQTTLTANMLYPAGVLAQALSANATNTSTDTILSDARLDMQETATQPSSVGANITWTMTANNGGNFAARDSAAVGDAAALQRVPGVTGIFLETGIPVFNSASLVLQSTPICTLSGASSGATATLYYYGPSNTFSSTPPVPLSNTAYIGCLITGGTGGLELPSAPSGSSGAGSVTTPQVTFTFVTGQPSGTGSTSPSAVSVNMQGWIDGQPWATGAQPLLGPNFALGTPDAAGLGGTIGWNATSGGGSGNLPPGGNSNAAGSQAYIAPTNSTNVGTAVYVGSDSTTQGLWHAASTPWTPYVYGSDGYTVLGGTAANPSYATVTLGGSYTLSTWQALGTTTDARAPYGSSASASQVAAQDYCSVPCTPPTFTPFTIDVNITDGNTHQFSLYLLDWSTHSDQDGILVTDQTHGANLLLHVFNSFNNTNNPMYVRWNISGHVRFTLYWSQPVTDAATFSAYFFDPVTRSAVTSSSSGSYVTTDTLTQGNWTPGSGGDGYDIAGFGSSLPTYAAACCSWYGNWTATWTSSTSDVRGVYQAPLPSTRVASQWYAGTWGVGIPMTDGNVHAVALYFLDWSATTCSENVYVADAATGAIFDARSLAGFHNGAYGVWNLKGNIVFYFVQTDNSGLMATVSGIFWGNRVPHDTLVNTVSPTGNQPPGTNLTYTTTFNNNGVVSSLSNSIVNPVPANTYFQVSSATSTVTGTGLTVAIAYSNNGGGSYVYTPVSGGGGAPTGYDRNVTNVQWTFTGTLSQGTGLNTGSVAMTVMIQ